MKPRVNYSKASFFTWYTSGIKSYFEVKSEPWNSSAWHRFMTTTPQQVSLLPGFLPGESDLHNSSGVFTLSVHSGFHVAHSARRLATHYLSAILPIFPIHSALAVCTLFTQDHFLSCYLSLCSGTPPCKLAVKHVDYTTYESHEPCRL